MNAWNSTVLVVSYSFRDRRSNNFRRERKLGREGELTKEEKMLRDNQVAKGIDQKIQRL